jgi:hypothetical protein
MKCMQAGRALDVLKHVWAGRKFDEAEKGTGGKEFGFNGKG